MVTFSTDAGPECPSCKRRLPAGAKFCGFDGTILGGTPSQMSSPPAQRLSPETQIDRANKYCPECQTIYPPHALFCSTDGSKLAAVAAAAAQKPEDDERMPVGDLVGHTLAGKYKLEELIGIGGMAVVYRAVHVNIERPVVVKIVQGHLVSSERTVKRFEQECKLTARINHPNVVSVFDVGFINGRQPYLVMEYIKGRSLRDVIDPDYPMHPRMAAEILIQICRGLSEAHALGIIHRDLKPENIILQDNRDRPDWVKIVDFGIAHLVEGKQRYTKTGNVVGTADYMAPEQLRAMPLDGRSDIYALGVLTFEMLTARVPFEADTAEAILVKQLMEAPLLPSDVRLELSSNSAPFDRICARAMQKNPDDRYQTVSDMRLDLETALTQLASVS